MKAIRVSEYGGPSVLKLEEIPTPQPGPGQVLVRNHAVGVNPVDTYLRSNTDNRGPKLPYTPGSDTAGVVEAVGSGVTGVKAGDRVYVGGTVSGAYAELSLCEPAQVHPLSANVSFAQGAAMNVPVRHRLPRPLPPRPRRGRRDPLRSRGERRRGHRGRPAGAGARHDGHRHGGHRARAAAGLRAGRPPRPRSHRAGVPERAGDLTGGRGPDIMLEMLANVNLQKDLGVIALRGRIVVIGNRGTTEINARFAMNKDAAILGMALGNATPGQLAGIHAALVEGLRNGTLRPVVGQEIPLAQAPRAHEAVMEAGHHGKVVLVP